MENHTQYCFERYEKKYIISPDQQKFLLDTIQSHIEEDYYGKYSICNVYYDTDNWQLVRSSVEKPVYKEKLRVRSYGSALEDSEVFIELKKKFDGIVYKRRISTELYSVEPFLCGLIPGSRYGQIGREIEWFQSFYHARPKVFIGYDRIAFTGTESNDVRITFDSNIRWRTNRLTLRFDDSDRQLIPNDKLLMELKLPDACPIWLCCALSEAGIFPVSFSKYGFCYQSKILRDSSNLKIGKELYCA